MVDNGGSLRKPRIGIMIGDPGGIGPEVVLKALATGEPGKLCTPILIGAKHVLDRTLAACRIDMPLTVLRSVDEAEEASGVAVLEAGDLDPHHYDFGRSSAESGDAVWAWREVAVSLAADGKIDGWVMAPIDSGSLKAAGRSPDDFLPESSYLLRLSGPMRIVPLSEHIPLSEVAASVTPEKVTHVIRLLADNLHRWGIPEPRIAVAGINPHAMFPEDKEKVLPGVERARANGIDATGPIAPDSVFRHLIDGQYDAVVTMYHDQGQIPLKTSNFEGACTVFMGMPYVTVTVPHGSAYEIAGRCKAQHHSMLAALTTAARLAGGGNFTLPSTTQWSEGNAPAMSMRT